MTIRQSLIGVVLLALAGGGGWYAWHRYTAPVPPHIPLDNSDEALVMLVEKGVNEVRKTPRSPKAWGKLSMILIANDFPEQAIPCLGHAEKFDRQSPRWPYMRGFLLLEQKPHEAIVALRRALELGAEGELRAATLFRLGFALVSTDQLDEAAATLQTLSEMEPDSPRLHFALGLLACARNDRLAALKHLTTLTEHPCARKKACFLLAGLTDDKEKAREYHERSTRLPKDRLWPNPFEDDVQPYEIERSNRLAQYKELEQQGRRVEAVQVLRKVVANSPDGEVCSLLGVSLCFLDSPEEAVEALRMALAFNPQHVKSLVFLAAALLRKGEKLSAERDAKEKARALFLESLATTDKALALQNNHGYAHLIRGKALKQLERTEESLRALREAVVCQPELFANHLALGEALAEAGQLREGLEFLENAVRLAPPNTPGPRQALEKWRTKQPPPK